MTVTAQRAEGLPEHLTVLIAGLPGSGLERVAATWPDPLFAVRGGAGAPRPLPFIALDSLEGLKSLLVACGKPPVEREAAFGVPVRTLVLDTLAGVEQLVGSTRDEARLVLRALQALPLDVVLLSHLRPVDDRVELASALTGEIHVHVDAALLLTRRQVTVRHDGEVVRHDIVAFLRAWPDPRHPWIVDNTGALPPEVEVGFAQGQVPSFNDGLPEPSPPAAGPPRAQEAAPPAAAPRPAAPAAQVAPASRVAVATPPPAPPAAQDEDDEEEDDDGLPECTEKRPGCLGRVESSDALDLSDVRFHRPMCGPCQARAYEEQPRKVPRKAAKAVKRAPAPPSPPDPRPGPSQDPVAVVPHGEVVGQIGTDDDALKAFLNS